MSKCSSNDDENFTRPHTPSAAPGYSTASAVHVSPTEIHPILKCRKQKKRCRSGKSTVLTRTPIKKMLEDRTNKNKTMKSGKQENLSYDREERYMSFYMKRYENTPTGTTQ